jgi:hypothetical protein
MTVPGGGIRYPLVVTPVIVSGFAVVVVPAAGVTPVLGVVMGVVATAVGGMTGVGAVTTTRRRTKPNGPVRSTIVPGAYMSVT